MNVRMIFLLNLVVFQGAWFACVLGSKSSYPMLYPVLGFCAVLGLVILSKRFGAAFPFLLSSVALGMVGDSLLVRLELLAFYANPTVGGAPLWMIILWANFGLMLRPLFPWFLENNIRCLLGFSIGGVGWNTALAILIEWGIAGLVLRQIHLKYPKLTDESA
jgi:hypothetical protein